MSAPAPPPAPRDRSADIAVVGLSVHFPGAADPRAFWGNLSAGRESIADLTEAELRAAGVSAAELADPRYVRRAATLAGVADFDPEFFGFSPKEAGILDPQHRHFLECCWEALEDAAIVPERFDGAIGVFGGCGMGLYFARHLLPNAELMRSVGYFLLRHTGNDKDFLATRVSYCLDLRGPSVGIQTACSTSLVAVHVACQSLLSRECDLALAGGSTIELPLGHGYLAEENEILSPDGHNRSFDARAQGTVFASGAGVAALRRLDDALRDGDPIYAVIRATAVNNDGARKVGYLAPSVDGQAAAITEALALAGVSADEIGHVECHGTATPMGDPIEVAALTQAFRRTTPRKGFCGIGSVKSNIGHLDTAAGVASLAKVALSFRHGLIPPSLHFERPNPAIDFAGSPFFVDAAPRPWPADEPALAGVNSLGVGGTNAFVVMERAPERAPAPAARRPQQLLALSARNEAALADAARRLAAHLRAEPGADLADIAYTLAAGRRAFAHRRVLCAGSREEAIALLESSDPQRVFTHAAAESAPGVAFLLPGGGAQHPRMAAVLLDEPAFREPIERGLALLEGRLDTDLREVWFPSDERLAWAEREFQRPSLQLPAIFLTEYALAQLWMSWGVQPDALLGHSLGENTAACLAGVFSFEDALGLVALRGRLFETLPRGGMLSVALAPDAARARIGDAALDIAVVNAPELCVVSGPEDALDAFARRLAEEEIETQRVPITIAAHSRMLAPILGEFGDYLRGIRLSPPRIPMLSNRHGGWLSNEDATRPDYWVEHLRHPVQFARNLETVLEDPSRVLLEVGPGRTLASLARLQPGFGKTRTAIPSLRHPDEKVDDLAFLLTAYGRLWTCGAELDPRVPWPEGPRPRLSLPAYPFQRHRYWIEEAKAAAVAVEPQLTRIAAIEDWGFAPEWREAPPPAAAPAGRHAWLLFLDADGVGAGVAARLRAAGQEVVEVREGDSYRRLSPTHYVLSPERGREGYDSLVRDLVAAGHAPDRVVHFGLVAAAERFRPGSSFFHRNVENGFASVLSLVQALSAEGVPGPVHLTVAANGALQVADERPRWPEKALALGPCLALPRELPGWTCAFVDLELPEFAQHRRSARRRLAEAAADAASQVFAGLAEEGANGVYAWRGGRRLRRHFAARPLPAAPASVPLPERAVCLITGGAGGIGATLARHLARTLRARLVLTGRTPLPPRERWDAWLRERGPEDPAARRIAQVRELEALGAEVFAAAADVTDLLAMRAVVEEAEQRFGRVDAVIHAAGVLRDGPLLAKTQAEIEEVFAPKVYGTQVLLDVFEQRALPRLVLFSSTSAAVSPPGQADYVAANSFLDAVAAQQDGRGGRCVLALGWGIWSEVGMAARAAAGEPPLPAPRAPAAHQLLDARLLVEGETVLFESQLSPETHWILDEHRTRSGDALVPGTAVVELATAALRELGEERPFEIRDLWFLRPLHVGDGESRRVRVRLQPSEEGWNFELLGHRVLADGARGWELHAQARLLLRALEPAEACDLAAIAARCPRAESAAPGGALATGQDRYLDFGPRWASLREVRLGAAEAIGRFELPSAYAAETAQHRLHPALFDRATGFAMELIEGYREAPSLWAPFSCEAVRVHGALPARAWSWIRRRADSGAEVALFDLTLAGEDGRVVAEVDGLGFKRIPEEAAFALPPPPRAHELEREAGAEARRADGPGAAEFRAMLAEGIRPVEGMEALARVLAESGPPARLVSSLPLDALERAYARLQADPAADGARFERPALASAYLAPRDEIERTLAGFWEELLGVDRAGVEDDFFALGGHSLLAVRLFAKVKKAFQVELPISVLFEAPTIALGAALIRARIGDSGPAARAEAPRPRFTHLVPMSPARPGERLPFFLVAGMFGNVLNLRHLAHLVGAERPFYGLQARGLLGDHAPHETFEEMARAYLEEVRAVQPHGPYLLGGFSGGGITAYEMAQQLRAAGEAVGLLVFLDTPLPQSPPLSSVDKATIHAQRLRRRGPIYVWQWARDRVRWELEVRRQRAQGNGAVEDPAQFRSREIEAAFKRALDRYQVQPWPGEVRLFRPALDEAYRLRGGRTANRMRMLIWSDNGWSQHVACVRVSEVPGDHDSMVLEPNVRVLAARLRTDILAAEAAIGTVAASESIPAAP